MSSFLSALTYPFRGIGYFLRRPALWKYFAAAVAINVVLFAVLIYLFLHYRQDLNDALLPARWWHWLRAGLGWLLTAVVFVALLCLFTFVVNMLATETARKTWFCSGPIKPRLRPERESTKANSPIWASASPTCRPRCNG